MLSCLKNKVKPKAPKLNFEQILGLVLYYPGEKTNRIEIAHKPISII